MSESVIKTSSILSLKVNKAYPNAIRMRDILKYSLPTLNSPKEINSYKVKNFPNILRGLWKIAIAKLFRIPTHYGALWLTVNHSDGTTTKYGLASLRVVTTAGAGFIVDGFQNLVELEVMKYHGFGTGTTAEASGDTALVTELTSEYVSDNVRPTGSQTENGATVYRTVATLDPDADVSITEHGIFSQAATGGGVLLDRSKFSAVNLIGSAGDTLTATYDFTVTAGS